MDIALPFEIETDQVYDYLGGNAIKIERSTEFAQLVVEYDARQIDLPEVAQRLRDGNVAIRQTLISEGAQNA
jgi:hypothetical protein